MENSGNILSAVTRAAEVLCGIKEGPKGSSVARQCKYLFLYQTGAIDLGTYVLAGGEDMDDGFPRFHSKYFDRPHKKLLENLISGGGVLVARSLSGEEPDRFLAYTLGDPDYWYGRESTLKYFGIIFVPAS